MVKYTDSSEYGVEHYRYSLFREWDASKKQLLFILINPSTGDGEKDDKTIEFCVKYADKNGFGSIQIVNIFARRESSPAKLFKLPKEAWSTDNNIKILNEKIEKARTILCGWGNYGEPAEILSSTIAPLLVGKDTRCMRYNSSGTPTHPSYAKSKPDEVGFFKFELDLSIYKTSRK